MTTKHSQLLFLGTTLLAIPGLVFSKGEITNFETESVSATSSSYVKDAHRYEWGMSDDLLLKYINYDSKRLPVNSLPPNLVKIRRVANSHSYGQPCSIFVSALVSYKYKPTFPGDKTGSGNCNLGQVITDSNINYGSLDLFSNTVDRSSTLKNIERIDVIYSSGLKSGTEDLAHAGHFVIEKSGNNPVKIAAILSLDENKNPKTYGPLISIYPATFADATQIRYGITNVEDSYGWLTTEPIAPQDYLADIGVTQEPLGAAFVSLADLGLSANQVYFGVSLIPSDVNSTTSDLINPLTYPLNTPVFSGESIQDPLPFGGDADLKVGIAGAFELVPTSDNTQPTQNDDGNSAGSNDSQSIVTTVLGETTTQDITDVVPTQNGTTGGGGGSGSFGLFSLLSIALFRRFKFRSNR